MRAGESASGFPALRFKGVKPIQAYRAFFNVVSFKGHVIRFY